MLATVGLYSATVISGKCRANSVCITNIAKLKRKMSKVFLVLHLVNNMVLKTSAADARQCVEPVENSAE